MTNVWTDDLFEAIAERAAREFDALPPGHPDRFVWATVGAMGRTLRVAHRIVEAQATDEALWCPVTAPEAYVVQELRALHSAVEGSPTAIAAIEDP